MYGTESEMHVHILVLSSSTGASVHLWWLMCIRVLSLDILPDNDVALAGSDLLRGMVLHPNTVVSISLLKPLSIM